MTQQTTQWLIYAIASGSCAAINGVFAKLTTTQLTTAWACSISRIAGLESQTALVEYVIRASFLVMNLAFNGVMWALFTRALTLSSSTVRVSVINTSANFMITAVLGWAIFSEELPGLWWIGAGLLVAGSVIIGRREESSGAEAVELKSAREDATEENTKTIHNEVRDTSIPSGKEPSSVRQRSARSRESR